MVKKICYLFVVGFCILFCSCSRLTRTQVRTSDSFFSSLQNYGSYHWTLHQNVADIRYNRKLLHPVSYSSDTVMVNSLKSIYEDLQGDLDGIDKNNIAIHEMENYFKNYEDQIVPFRKNSKQKENIKKINNNKLRIFFENLYGMVTFTKNIFYKPVKAIKIRKYIVKGELIVSKDILLLNKYADSVFQILQLEDSLLEKDYVIFLNNLKDKPDSYEYYATYNPIFLNQYDKLYQTMKLAEELRRSSSSIVETFNTLYFITSKRKKIKKTPVVFDSLSYHISIINGIMERMPTNNE